MATFKKFLEKLNAAQAIDAPFDTSTTDSPYYDEMMKDPHFFKEKKGIDIDLKWMTPKDYMERVVAGQRVYGMGKGSSIKTHNDLVESYTEKMKSGEKFPLLVLEYIYDKKNKLIKFTQEGKHRAVAAKNIGIKKIPVLVVNNRLDYEVC